MGREIPAEEGVKGNKKLWNWLIRIDELRYELKDGVPIIRGYKQLPVFLEITTGSREQEFELIDSLTTNRGAYNAPSDSVLYKTLKHRRDGLFRLVVFKQSQTSKALKVPSWGFWGQTLVSKNRDLFLFETRYFYAGKLDPRNLETRDPLEDARRKHVDQIPSGGLDYPW